MNARKDPKWDRISCQLCILTVWKHIQYFQCFNYIPESACVNKLHVAVDQTFIHRCCFTHLMSLVLVHCATVFHFHGRNPVTKVPYILVRHVSQRVHALLVSALEPQRAAKCVESVAFWVGLLSDFARDVLILHSNINVFSCPRRCISIAANEK